MSFKSNIPEQVLAHPNTRKFVSVMDGVNEVKSDIIFTSLRAYNPALLLDKNWLLKRLGDYGVDFIPMEFPLPVIQQFLLNAEAIEVPSENDAPAISWLKSEAYVTVSVSAVKQR
jgi:hypothetical protein